MTKTAPRALACWLYACCGLVFLMVVVGAITRLTESGLSITEWKPLTGAIPPLNDAAWAREFDLYKASPEFTQKHFWMQLADFKSIYFWEWSHRFLGRLIGLAYALPLFAFWLRGKIPAGYKLKLLGVLLLGGLQGGMGWYMVESGLIDHPEVSHYRLAAHLLLALLIFASMFWLALSLNPPRAHSNRPLFLHGKCAIMAFIFTVLWGAYTAGLDAGLIFNDSFPKMGGQWTPPDMLHLEPHWRNFFENPAAVQFTHRWLAITTVLTVLGFWLHGVLRKNTFPALHALGMMIIMQMGLGVSTLLSDVALPLAVLHQAGAVIVLSLLLTCLRQLKA